MHQALFVSFGLLLVFGMLWPETIGMLQLNRTKATIWCTSFLLIPALTLTPYRALCQAVDNLTILLWSFAYLLFLVHAWLAVFVIFNGIADTIHQMGSFIAGTNFVLVIVWGLDVLLIWSVAKQERWLDIAHAAVQVFVFLVFAITLIALRGGLVMGLGIVFTSIILVSTVVALAASRRVDLGSFAPEFASAPQRNRL